MERIRKRTERNWNGTENRTRTWNGTRVELERNENMERNGGGTGTERNMERNGGGTGTERRWNWNGTKKEHNKEKR